MAMATKDQERKALDRIRKIVQELGEGSYIGMAFEGCFEVAEENIENDFACSMKQRAEKAESELEKATESIKALETGLELAKAETERLKTKTLTKAEAEKIQGYLINAERTAKVTAQNSAEKIVEFAENPDSNDFRQAVQDNRISRKKAEICHGLIQRMYEVMQ